MHPDISRLPSKAFYDGKLQDGPDMARKTMAAWHAVPVLGTYRFFNVDGSESAGARHSVINRDEIKAIINLVGGLRAKFGGGDGLLGRVGVVTPYKAQQSELRYQLKNHFGERVFEEIE
jgi:senataxin